MSASKFASAFGALATIATLATSVEAHGFVTGIVAGGTYHGGYLVNQYPYSSTPPDVVGWTEGATDLGFVDQYNSADIICHKSATNAKLTATVAAGSDVTFQWGTDKWPESHHGPVLGYLANCGGDCATVDKSTLKFVKVEEAGLLDNSAAPGKWASDKLIANNNSWTTTIPANIAAGNYVFRHEIIALHSAGSANGAQAYPFCFNLEITGGGSAAPAGTLGTELYSAQDPGILVSIYSPGLDYKIPGPAIAAEFSGAAAPAPAPAPTTAATSLATTSAIPTTTLVASTTVSSQVAAITSAPATTASAAPSAVISAISSLTAALPSSVLTSPAPAPTGSSGSGSPISTSGMTVAELLDLLKQILTQLLSSGSTKARRHARDIIA